MPNKAKPYLVKLKTFVNDFGDVFSIKTDAYSKKEYLFCNACQTRVECDQRSQVRQHIKTQSHIKCLKGYDKNQLTVTELFEKSKSTFNQDLCRFLIKMNIPFHRVSDDEFKRFINKYTQYSSPAPNTLWNDNNLKYMYDNCIAEIRGQLKDEFIWIAIDETPDIFHRKVLNVIVGALNIDINKCSNNFVLNLEFINDTKSSTIVQSVMNAMTILWPNGIKYDKVLLLLTDRASYMKSAGNTLCNIFPKLIHLTCMAHAIHNLCEYIAKLYPNVNDLISNGKKIIVKSNERRNSFKQMFPQLTLPPEPVRTRWGQWINSIEWYTKHFVNFCEFVSELESKESVAIENAKTLISTKKSSLVCDMTYLNANFSSLPQLIKKLEADGTLLFESFQLLESAFKEIKQLKGKYSAKINEKLDYILKDNPGYAKMKAINAIISGDNIDLDKFGINLSSAEIAAFKWSPITTCDVERSFSKYKFILNDRRFNLSEIHLKYYFIVNLNRN